MADATVTSLNQKLSKFKAELPEQERNVLNWILARAEGAEGELGDAALEGASGGGSEVTVGWKYSFTE
jgi:hypothetical protein